MRTSRSAALAILGALVPLLGVAPFCSPVAAQTMPCCSPASHCDAGMKSAGCCRVEPSPATSHPQTLQRAARVCDPRAFLAVAVLESGDAPPTHAAPARTTPAGPPLTHYDPVPLYLLNASILR
jgi:hypothetical protein